MTSTQTISLQGASSAWGSGARSGRGFDANPFGRIVSNVLFRPCGAAAGDSWALSTRVPPAQWCGARHASHAERLTSATIASPRSVEQ